MVLCDVIIYRTETEEGSNYSEKKIDIVNDLKAAENIEEINKDKMKMILQDKDIRKTKKNDVIDR
jgi:hypothetical protein